ncbi:GH39 family glycosyl hydrolase [Motilibacter deserti]|uniref:Cellulase family glycosylhydrolase n=1 Tax=Motilibacter deserti TaxID=2714956 RepID=A0ABX0GY35_9ACTN|nr:glycosyl hydrolase [Motilibacter deserti]NHC14610.1 cellulase family glycosylhydrolase [Motilibacter deserti]
MDFGSVRLWDDGTTWADLQPAPSRWNWEPLDRAVAAAERAGLRPMLVLGQTPAWASSDPRAPGVHVPGTGEPPRSLALWSAYVTAVADRYYGRIRAYEVWNEPNYVSDYFHGSEADMARLTESAYAAVKAVDPDALVVSPGLATRTPGQRGWLYRYLDELDPAAVDVIALHLYPPTGEGPETAAVQLDTVITALRARGIDKPVWNTEVNYGVVEPEAVAPPIPDDVAAGFLARTLIVNRASGVSRVYWYAWWHNRSLGINLTDDAGPTRAMRAWRATRAWLEGGRLAGCRTRDDEWSCVLHRDDGSLRLIVWTTATPVGLPAPAGAAALTGLDGRETPLDPGATVRLTGTPTLITGPGLTAAAAAAFLERPTR